MGESVTDSHSLQARDGAVVILCFSQNLLSDSWGILATVTLSENDEWVIGLEFELIEACCWVLEEFLKGNIEVISNTRHVGAEYVFNGLISVT